MQKVFLAIISNKKELKIALDFDSVLSDTMISWTQKYNEKHRTTYTKNDIRSWEFWNDLNISSKYAGDIFREAWEDWIGLPATEDNLAEKVGQLSEHGTIDIVTSVDKSHLKYVKQWSDREQIHINEIVHAGTEKIYLPYDLFIDDSPNLAKKAELNNKNCFLYNQQWNREVLENGYVTRINNLTEAANRIAEKSL